MRHFEDFAAGQVYDLGTVRVTRDEIVAFATQFDPQPFHVDEAAAAESAFGGLVASGWHTISLWMRLYVDGLLADTASMGSPGWRRFAGSRRYAPATSSTGRPRSWRRRRPPRARFGARSGFAASSPTRTASR